MRTTLILATENGVVTASGIPADGVELSRTLEGSVVTAVAARGRRVLAGLEDGLLASDDMGAAWRQATAGLTVRHVRWLAAHREEQGRLLAGTEPAAVFYSQDAGEHWHECPEVAELRDAHGWYLPYSPEAGCVRGFAQDGPRAYGAVEQGGALRSDDYGETWRLVGGSTGDTDAPASGCLHPDVHSILIHPSSLDLVFAPTGGGLYRSGDGGDTWELLYECYCRAVWVNPRDPDDIILGPADGVSENGRIERSDDGGRNWRPLPEGLQTPWPEHMVERFLFTEDGLLAVLSNGEVLMSDPREPEWRRVLADAGEVNAIAVAAG